MLNFNILMNWMYHIWHQKIQLSRWKQCDENSVGELEVRQLITNQHPPKLTIAARILGLVMDNFMVQILLPCLVLNKFKNINRNSGRGKSNKRERNNDLNDITTLSLIISPSRTNMPNDSLSKKSRTGKGCERDIKQRQMRYWTK